MPLDEHVAEQFAAHQGQPAQTTDQLRQLVRAHLAAAQTASAHSPFVDLETAEALATTCLALLDHVDAQSAHHDLVQAACLYFAAQDDEEDDFASPVGFDDDAEVIRHVAQTVGRPDLAPEL
jgi:hypothetical protein